MEKEKNTEMNYGGPTRSDFEKCPISSQVGHPTSPAKSAPQKAHGNQPDTEINREHSEITLETNEQAGPVVVPLGSSGHDGPIWYDCLPRLGLGSLDPDRS